MENVGNDNRRLFIIIVVIITVLLSSTYAFLSLEDTSGSATGETCSDVIYTTTDITTSSLISTDIEPDEDNDASDETDNPISKITVKQSCEIYNEIYLNIHTNSDGTTANISEYKALKYKLVSSNEVVASGVIDIVGDLEIATIPLLSNEVDYYLYIWVDRNISVGQYNGKTYSGYIYATTEHMTSTITN